LFASVYHAHVIRRSHCQSCMSKNNNGSSQSKVYYEFTRILVCLVTVAKCSNTICSVLAVMTKQPARLYSIESDWQLVTSCCVAPVQLLCAGINALAYVNPYKYITWCARWYLWVRRWWRLNVFMTRWLCTTDRHKAPQFFASTALTTLQPSRQPVHPCWSSSYLISLSTEAALPSAGPSPPAVHIGPMYRFYISSILRSLWSVDIINVRRKR